MTIKHFVGNLKNDHYHMPRVIISILFIPQLPPSQFRVYKVSHKSSYVRPTMTRVRHLPAHRQDNPCRIGKTAIWTWDEVHPCTKGKYWVTPCNTIYDNRYYHKIFDIRCTKSKNSNASRISLQLSLCNILKPSGEWRCSWSSADRRCSNYIWLINSLIAYNGASYIRDLMVYIDGLVQNCSNSSALALKLLQSYTKPLILPHTQECLLW